MGMGRHFDECLPQGLIAMTREQDIAPGSPSSVVDLPGMTGEGVICFGWSRNVGFHEQSLCNCSLPLGDQTGRNENKKRKKENNKKNPQSLTRI